MMQNGIWKFGGRFAVGVVLLAGCQGIPSTSNSMPMNSMPERNVRLNSKQVADMQMAMGQSLEQRNDPVGAIRAYEAALQTDATRLDACVRLAVLNDRQGQFAASSQHYQKALERQPANADILCNYGYSLILQNRFDDSEKCLRRAIEVKPDHARAHNNLGLVLARKGRADEALAQFRQAGCTEANAHTNLAYSVTLNGNLMEAARHYERALALQPDLPAAKTGLDKVKALAMRPPTEPQPMPTMVANPQMTPAIAQTSVVADLPVAAASPPPAPMANLPMAAPIAPPTLPSDIQSVKPAGWEQREPREPAVQNNSGWAPIATSTPNKTSPQPSASPTGPAIEK